MTDYRIRVPDELALDDDLVAQAQHQIYTRRPDKMGTRSGVWFLDDRAIRSPIRDDSFFERYASSSEAKIDYLREAIILRDLEENGFNVPKAYSLYIPMEEIEPPILVMSRLNIQSVNSLKTLGSEELEKAKKKHRDAIDRARNIGYVPRNACWQSNCGVTPERQVYLFDFEAWGFPSRITDKVLSCLEGHSRFAEQH